MYALERRRPQQETFHYVPIVVGVVPGKFYKGRSQEKNLSREPDGHRQRRSPGWSGLDQRHSSWNVLQHIPGFIGSGALCRVASVSARRSVYSSLITAHKIS